MPNPNPNKATRFAQVGKQPLASKVRGARFPRDVDAVLDTLSSQAEYIRAAVAEKLRADGLLKED